MEKRTEEKAHTTRLRRSKKSLKEKEPRRTKTRPTTEHEQHTNFILSLWLGFSSFQPECIRIRF